MHTNLPTLLNIITIIITIITITTIIVIITTTTTTTTTPTKAFSKAGNAYKLANLWQSAGDAFKRSADCSLALPNGDGRHEAVTKVIITTTISQQQYHNNNTTTTTTVGRVCQLLPQDQSRRRSVESAASHRHVQRRRQVRNLCPTPQGHGRDLRG